MDIRKLIELVKELRRKCPWDREQTLQSIKNNVIEESYELVEAIEQGDACAIQEEIGDMFFLGFFLATIFEEEKGITLDELVSSTVKKYREKHPHVFERKELKNQDEVLRFWQHSKKDMFNGISIALPALLAARIIQERASKVGFDWLSYKGPLDKLDEEIGELKSSIGSERVSEELGDLLFACVNLARHLKIDPEDALRYANKKFISRFRAITNELKKRGKNLEEVSLEEMDKIWNEIKRQEDR
jgi:tetrapyrrole methylase family protein/MazG family protein